MDFPGSIAISGHREVSPIVKMRERGMYMVQSIHVFLAGDKPAGLSLCGTCAAEPLGL